MTRIGISLFGCDGGRSGIGRYARELLERFPDLSGEARFEALVHASEAEGLMRRDSPILRSYVSENYRSPLPNILWNQLGLGGACRKSSFDVLFVPGGNRRLPVRAPCPVVATVHDLNARHVPGKYGPLRDTYTLRVLPWMIRRLHHILTVSESSKRDIVEVCGVAPEKVTVIPLAADPAVFHQRDPDQARLRAAEGLGFEEPFLLYVSRIEHPGKNHVRLVEAFEALKASTGIPHKLVLAGPDWNGAEHVHRRAEASTMSRDIVFTGYLPGGLLPWLYAAASVSVVPSLYEGFGLPVLEAMASGSPVACSDRGSLPEVGGEAACYFDPEDPQEIASQLASLLLDPDRAASARSRGLARAATFSWERTARRTLEVLLKVSRGEPVVAPGLRGGTPPGPRLLRTA